MAPLTTDEPGAIGPYQVVGRLGHGGLLLGRAPGGEHVAITAVPADLAVDPGFRAEVAAALMVSVAAVAPVVDADLDGPVPWLATAYVAGPTLAEAVRDNGPVPAGIVPELAAWLAEGVRAWHAAGLVHRNLNPSNVVLASGGPRMVGFGSGPLASGLPGAESSGLSGAAAGSAGFWSPEQALGQDVGPPSDIFSLGAVLVFAGGGAGPFGSGSSALLMYRVVNSPAALDGLAGELRTLVGNCLAKEPGERPDASRLLAELEAIRSTAGAGSIAWAAGSSAVAGGAVGAGSSGVAGSSEVAGSSGVAGEVASASAAAGAAVGASWPEGGRGGGRHSRRGWRGSRAGAWIAGGLLAVACVVAIFFLSGGDPLSSAGNVPPQAGSPNPAPDSTSRAPLIMSSSPAVPPGSSPGRHQGPAPDGITPATLQGPSPSSFLSPPGPARVFSAPPTSASTSPSPSRSPSPSPSPSSSKSPSPSPSPSPSSSKSPSPSPSPSPSSSKSASSSPSPSASQTAASPHSSSLTSSAASVNPGASGGSS